VRPLLPDDGTGTDMVVSYPTSTEALGRGIELVQNGIYTSFFPPSSAAAISYEFHIVYMFIQV